MNTRMILALACAAVLAACSSAESQTSTFDVTATMPTQYTDGTALPLAHLASWTVVYTVNGGAPQTKVVTALSAVTSTTVPKTLGTTCFQNFVTTKGASPVPPDSRNSSSSQEPNPPVCVTVAGPPKPPTGLTVQ